MDVLIVLSTLTGLTQTGVDPTSRNSQKRQDLFSNSNLDQKASMVGSGLKNDICVYCILQCRHVKYAYLAAAAAAAPLLSHERTHSGCVIKIQTFMSKSAGFTP